LEHTKNNHSKERTSASEVVVDLRRGHQSQEEILASGEIISLRRGHQPQERSSASEEVISLRRGHQHQHRKSEVIINSRGRKRSSASREAGIGQQNQQR
jgi:hypothetical protein